MIRVMLVDDNRVALEYFSRLVKWEDLGYELVCTAIDGASALLQFQKFHPEVIITDVQMPNMDGIELAREVMKAAPQTVVIFLSSYAEFSYIRSAMQYGVTDYLLKHEMKKEQLTQKLLSVKKLLEKNRGEHRIVAEGYLKKLLQTVQPGAEDEQGREKYLRYFPGRYNITILGQAHIFPSAGKYVDSRTEPADPEQLRKTVYLQNPSAVLVETEQPWIYVLLAEHESDTRTRTEKLKSQIERHSSSRFTLLYLRENVSIEECVNSYARRRGQLDQLFFYAPSAVLEADCLRRVTKGRELFTRGELEQRLRADASQGFIQMLDSAFLKAIGEHDIEAYDQLTGACLDVLFSWQGRLIDYQNVCVFRVMADGESRKQWMDAVSLFYWIRSQMENLRDVWRENQKYGWSAVTQNALLYIYDHYGNSELTAEEIAEHTGMSLNQLNQSVKKETGDTVWKMLTRVRMEAAKKWLDTTRWKIVDISRKAGYNTIAYFSTAFRKYYHTSPQEYRDHAADLAGDSTGPGEDP